MVELAIKSSNMLYSSHTANKFNSSFPHHILYLHCRFFLNFVSIWSIKLVVRIGIYGIVTPSDNDIVCPYFPQIHYSAYIIAILVSWKMLKEHKETENSKITRTIRKNWKLRKPGLFILC